MKLRSLSTLLLALATAAGAAVGCTGVIGTDDGKPAGEGDPSLPGGGGGGGSTTSPLPHDPGSKTIHRLNRNEYDNTVRDLLGTTSRPAAAEFPADDHGYGFDNIADVLALSPLQLELYERTAERLIDEAFAKPDILAKLVPCKLEEPTCAKTAIDKFGLRAFRRPLTEADTAKLLAFVTLVKGEGGTALEGVKLAMRAALMSPHFLFRVELDPDPSAKTAHPLTDYELASRLSYFLWSTMPDPVLFDLAATGKLHEPDTLRAQTLRMIEDPKAQAFVESFAGQWLQVRDMDSVTPDTTIYAGFDDTLRASMKKETTMFFNEFLHGELDVKQLVTADFTFLDARLATHYGLPAPATPFARVKLDGKRTGLFGQGTFLTTTSNANRTSPVKRGRWVLEKLLCTPPPPPPPGVEGLNEGPTSGGTVRERMEAHRKQPVCASCHSMMDPIGFGLENFDGVGKWRTTEDGNMIDATGVLPGVGVKFDGAVQLAGQLAEDSRVGRCVAQHLYTYALGRGPTAADDVYLDEISGAAKTSGNKMKDMIVQIVTSEPFRMRRPALEGGTP